MLRNALAFGIVAFALVGCYFLGPPLPPTPPNVAMLPDWNYFQSDNCISACWNELRPGLTTEEELMGYYQEQGIQEGQGREFGSLTVYRAFSENGAVVGSAFVKDGILFSLDLDGGNLELSTILNVLGEPENIFIEYDTAADSHTLSNIYFTSFYPSNGFIFYYDIRSGLRGERLSESEVNVCIDSSIVPIHVQVFESGNIEELIIRRDSVDITGTDVNEDAVINFIGSLSSWPGLGCNAVLE